MLFLMKSWILISNSNSDEEKKNKVTNDNAHVKAFEVTVKKKDGSSFIGQSLNISSYSTMADLSNTQEGIDYYSQIRVLWRIKHQLAVWHTINLRR